MLKSILAKILGLHQKAYVPNRFTCDGTCSTYNLFHYAKRNNKPGIGLLIDFEKAFDSVSFKFILFFASTQIFIPSQYQQYKSTSLYVFNWANKAQ